MERKPIVITPKEARSQINAFGLPLCIYAASTLLLYNGAAFFARYFPGIFGSFDIDLAVFAAATVIEVILTIMILHIGAVKLRLPLQDYLKKTEITPVTKLLLGCMPVAITLILMSLISIVTFFFTPARASFAFLGDFSSPLLIVKNIVYFALFIIIRPLADELIFRGVVQRQLGHYGRYFGVFASALLFALTQPNLSEALIAFFTGWFYAILTLKYHSLRPTIAAHISTAFFLWLLDAMPDQWLFVRVLMIIAAYVITMLTFFLKAVPYELFFPKNGVSKRLWKILFSASSIRICTILFVVSIILSLML